MAKKCKYKLLPAQDKFLFGFDKTKYDKDEEFIDVACYQGGFGSGKTFCGSLRGLLFALQWAGCKGLVGAHSQDTLDGTTKAKYLEHLAQMGMKEGEHYWLIDRKQKILLKNGSTIWFKTMSDWEQFRSFEFTFIELEEASLLTEKVFKELIARLRQQRRPEWKHYYRSIFLHTNPGGARGWIYKLFTNKKTKVPHYRIVFAATRENYHLGDGYEEELLSLYGIDEVQELLNGVDNDNDNTVAFPAFNQFNVVDNMKFDSNNPLILTCDFNYNPMCWYLIQQIGDTWCILKELIAQNVTTKEMCERILGDIQEYGTKKLTIMGDAHGRDKKTNGSDYGVMVNFFANKGYNVTLKVAKYNPAIKERLAILRRNICNGKNERKLFIDSTCEKLLYNFDECKNNLSTGGLRTPTDKEVQDDIQKLFLIHPVDAISYPMWYEDKLKDYATEDIKNS